MNRFKFLSIFVFILICGFLQTARANQARATFAGGCYWCMEEAMEKVAGVLAVISGFEGDTEAVDIQYDTRIVTYEQLLDAFWQNIDPTDGKGQFCDRGAKYRSAIYYHDETQKEIALESKKRIEARLNRPVVTEIMEEEMFSVAPEEDQDFYKKHPQKYNDYKSKCGRARRLQELWGR